MTNTLNKIMHNGDEYEFPWGVSWPDSSTDGNLAVFDGATWQKIKDWWTPVVSGDSGTTYTIKVSNSEPAGWTPSTTITFVS